MTMRSLPRILGAALAGAALVVILSIKLHAFRDYQIAEIAVYVTAVAGLTVLTGLSGQISLGPIWRDSPAIATTYTAISAI